MSSGQLPNVVFVFADQMRGMDMRCAGNDQVITPNLDRLAAEGTQFDRAYANCPVCTPSRAILLTGRYPLANQVIANDLPLPADMPTVGQAFNESGYRTGYIGKWHLDGVPRDKFTPPGPRRHGFEFWAAYNCSHDYYRADKYYRDEPEPVKIDGYEPAVQTDLALDFISAHDDRPFCLFLSWGPPHDPYEEVPEDYAELYDPATIKLRPNHRAIPSDSSPIAGDRDPQRTIAQYYAAITALDAQLGRILDRLDADGLTDNTIVVFTSDHGDMLWSQGKMMKQQPWEESIRIPFLVRWPGRVPAGAVDSRLLSIVDMAPTLLGLTGVREQPGMQVQGADLSDLVLGRPIAGPESVFIMDVVQVDQSWAQGIPEWRGVRTAQHTYVRLADGSGWLLYDDEADPYQLNNLIDDPALAQVRTQLDDQLGAWLRQVGDAFLDGAEHIRQLGLAELWNAREHELHPDHPRLL